MDQAAVIAFLSDPAHHAGQRPDRKETHGALVFLLPDRVYKLKRQVQFSFMDFSTADKRRDACRAEVRLNRRTSQGLYLGTRPIVATESGLAWGEIDTDPPGRVDTVVVMARFENTLLDVPANPEELTQLAEMIAAFHEAADRIEARSGAANLRATQDGNLIEIGRHVEADPEKIGQLKSLGDARMAQVTALLDRRAQAGCLRHCHGDLHLANICRWQGDATLFDCIEFNPDFAQIDTLYDLAFLLMDLDSHNRRADANLVLNRYLECRPQEVSSLSALPLMLSLRAQVRTKVGYATAALAQDPDQAAHHRREAETYLDRAIAYLHLAQPMLLAVGGVSGSGKSTLARDLAWRIGPVPGALVARADAIRKRLFGAAALTDRLPQEAYSTEASQRTYAEMERLCSEALAAGHSVIADATFLHADSRARIEDIAAKAGVPFIGLWLDLDRDRAGYRVEERYGDASDATRQVVDLQFNGDWGRIDWIPLDAAGGPKQTEQQALREIDRFRPDPSP